MTTWIVFRHAPESACRTTDDGATIVGSIAGPCERSARRAAHARWLSNAHERLELVPADVVPAPARRAARERVHVDLAAESRRMSEVFMDGRVP
jgi:hypothetical protein